MKKLSLIFLLPLAACGHGGKMPTPQTVSATPITPPKVKVVEVEVEVPAPVKPAPEVEKVELPPLPEELARSPQRLPDLVDGTLKGVMRDGAATDSMYNNLSARYRALVKVYNCVRDSVNEGDEKIKSCLDK